MRRHDRRLKYVVLGLFVAVGSLAFLLGRLRSDDVDAASLANFDPGFIISDYTMSNYNSMSVAEIQAFLTAKNPCNNRDYGYYQALSASNPNVSWHWKDGHFVCLSEELFGDGMVIGEGKTAAQIIYETAQEYKINPQVLIVLIQKESSLITDPIPNNYDYRTMTGFGCPDTAPCDAKYFGFKNQIRKAAWLFREVLDGGWTNYPLGENYVQYNPNAGCGGSIVNIRSLATSALYRYTPYQPNAGAISAGYGTAYCGAYGNRNFYLYFADWFGDPTSNGWVRMLESRNMIVSARTIKINPMTMDIDPDSGWLEIGAVVNFSSKIDVILDGEKTACLRTLSDTQRGANRCILMPRMKEFDIATVTEEYPETEYFSTKKWTCKVNLKNITADCANGVIEANSTMEIKGEVSLSGVKYLVMKNDYENGQSYGVVADRAEKQDYRGLEKRILVANKDTKKYVPGTDTAMQDIRKGSYIEILSETIKGKKTYYRTPADTNAHRNQAIPAEDLSEIEFRPFVIPRGLKAKKDTYSFNIHTKEQCDPIAKEDIIDYDSKILINDKAYYRSAADTNSGSYCVVDSIDMGER